jgi:hypothetical protein
MSQFWDWRFRFYYIKKLYIARLVQAGFSVLQADTDTVWSHDPFPVLRSMEGSSIITMKVSARVSVGGSGESERWAPAGASGQVERWVCCSGRERACAALESRLMFAAGYCLGQRWSGLRSARLSGRAGPPRRGGLEGTHASGPTAP